MDNLEFSREWKLSFSSLTCCSGVLSLFRREAVKPYLHAWAHDKFAGMENFKFATDRRLTAFVLGVKASDVMRDMKLSGMSTIDYDNKNNKNKNIPILLQTGNDDLEYHEVLFRPRFK